MHYDELDATAMAAAVREKRVAPDAFVAEARRRIAAVDGTLNAVVHEIPGDLPDTTEGDFAGVPLPLKNIGIGARGSAMSVGSRLFAEQTCDADTTLAARYRAAGMVFVARTNTPELALSFTAESALHGPCRNPWDTSRTAGGSSGGSAALVAAGVVPMAQSSDGAGSTRVPAAHCGIFGFKPSRMRNPVGPAVAEGIAGMSTPHAVSRSVRDAARLLDVGAGPDVGDPYAAPYQAGRFADALKTPPRKLRIGVQLSGPEGSPLTAECVAAARSTADLLAELGHEVVELAPGYDNAALKAAWRVIAGVSCAASVDRTAAARGLSDPDSLLEPVNAEWIAEGRGTSGTAYLAAVEQLHRTSRDMGQYFEQVDVYLSPTTAAVAPPIGWLSGAGLDLDTFYDRFWSHAPLTAVFNASGCPAMSVPLHWTGAGLPVGSQLGAGFGQDALLLQLAAQLETARPWAQRRPPVSAALQEARA